MLKKLEQITVLGSSLLGGSIGRAVLRCFSGIRVVGCTHRAITRLRAMELGVATEIVSDIKQSVSGVDLGCFVKTMKPAEHDRIFANVSHLPHVMAAALVNATNREQMKLAGRGFMDASRKASGPVNVWAEILLKSARNKRGELIRYKMQRKELIP